MAELSSRTIVLLPIQTVTADATGNAFVLAGRFTAARVRLVSGAGTGTSPTLNIYVQNGIRSVAATDTILMDATGAVVWNDFISFAQVTTAASDQFASVVGSGNFINAAQDGALGAGTVRNGPLGDRWRVKVDVGGTNPSFPTVSVVAEFIP